MVVELDMEDYKRGVEHLKYSVLGKLSLQRGEPVPTTMEVKEKLLKGLQVEDLQVIAMGKGVFHLRLNNLDDQCKALTVGSLFLRPGIMRFSRWLPGINNAVQVQTSAQVWIRIFNLPLEFRKLQNLMNISMGVGLPIKIDPLTLSLYHGLYARILVEVDLAKPITRRVLVTMKDASGDNEIEFFVEVVFENLPKFCEECKMVGHDVLGCKLGGYNNNSQTYKEHWRNDHNPMQGKTYVEQPRRGGAW